MTRRVDKVVVYITRGDLLLVFTHPDFPEAGLQVPAGTVEVGEAPADAARREAHEETGLERLSGWTFLGERERDMRDFGRDEVQRRFFFHARCDGPDARERWRWIERFPSEGEAPGRGPCLERCRAPGTNGIEPARRSSAGACGG